MYMLWIIYKYCVFQSGSNGPADTFNNKNIDGNNSLNVTVDIIVDISYGYDFEGFILFIIN